MRLNTKVFRNLAFAVMLAALPLAPLSGGALPTNCGPEWCPEQCALNFPSGGYMLWQGCDSGSCTGTGCAISGDHCTRLCIACYGEPEWDCQPMEGGLRN